MRERPLVVCSGGGTGGHLYPALAIADEVRALRPDVDVLFVGAEQGLEARVLPERGEEHVLLPLRGFDRVRPWANVRTLLGLLVGITRVLRLFLRRRPGAVVVTGGYAGAPAGLVAGLLGVPLVLQEQNALPGVTTRLLAPWARSVHVAFPEARRRLSLDEGRAPLTGNPVRARSTTGRDEARRAFGLPERGTVVVVIGGSQGSVALNGIMLDLVRGVHGGTISLPAGVRFLWATGHKHFGGVSADLERTGRPEWVLAVPYLDDLPAALVAADLALSRAGAMTTAELMNEGLPALLVPLPTAAADHQSHNARSLVDAGAALAVAQDALTAEALAGALETLLADPERLQTMRARALERARPDARVGIASDVVRLLPEKGGAS